MLCEGKVAVVTGAAGNGMGRSIALTLSREGAKVVINYRANQEAAEKIAAHINNCGGQALTVQGNVFIKEDCERLVGAAVSSFGKVDICVIGPGANWNPEKLTSFKPDNAMEDIKQEISPIYYLLPPVLRDMENRKWGRIIGIASNMEIPSPSFSYNAAKSVRIDALKLAVKEAWDIGVTVNVIAPGPVDQMPNLEAACAYYSHTSDWLCREKVTPQDIAEGVAFLCSDSAKYVTGCVLPYLF